MNLKSSPSTLAIIGIMIVLYWLFLTNGLTREILFGGFAGIILVYLYGTQEKIPISMAEAEKLAWRKIKDSQLGGVVPRGTLRLVEKELKDVVLLDPKNPLVKPDRFYFFFHVEARTLYGYLIIIGLYGSDLGMREIQQPLEFSLSKIEERKYDAGINRAYNESESQENQENE